MPQILKASDWKPEGVDELEPAALEVATNHQNTLVVAGPGAGKTELLAQRASFLLRTGWSPFPKRILAISFKRDAARNLKERVKTRCGPELARRFDSLTFDAFAKGLLDRFRTALPENFLPSADYELNFEIGRRLSDRLETLLTPDIGFTLADIRSVSMDRFYRDTFLGHPLCELPGQTAEPESAMALALWQSLVIDSSPSQVDFQMIGRLVGLLLQLNPLVLKGLRSTYSHLFLDEFQDTTSIQFDLTMAAFHGSNAVVTAVGDDKQRIMGWAGALSTNFEDFEREFGAEKKSLLLNHRSAPELVRIQNYFIQLLDPTAKTPRAAKTELEGECRVLVFENHNDEARWLAETVSELITQQHIEPREICILTRNRPDQYTAFISAALLELDIKSRVETEIQDLLTEPLVIFALACFKIALSERAKEAWSEAVQIVFDTNGIEEDSGEATRREALLAAFLNGLKNEIQAMQNNKATVIQMVKMFVGFVGEGKFLLHFPQYRQGPWYEEVVDKFAGHLSMCREAEQSWLAAVLLFEGADSVPIMTIHKSKGLEYNTVIFVGLEDSAMWTFRDSPDEEKRTFFVAFSRAVQRVFFTFCEVRERQGRGEEGQSRRSIGIFYDTLREAGIEEERVTF